MWNLKQHRSRYSKDVLSYLIINRSMIYQIKFHIFCIKKLILNNKIRNDQIRSLKEFNKKILELLAICSGNVEKMRKNQFSSEDKLEILKNDEDLFALSIPNPTNFQVIKKKKIRRGSS